MHISVVICTWNRAKLLDETLAAMHHLSIPRSLEWELLIVNNNCTDTTDEIITRHASRLPIRQLFEEKLGLSNARNCAVSAASGELIVWTDDDVIVSPDWLSEYYKAAGQWPDATYFGGTIEPWFEVEPPKWFKWNYELLRGCYALNSYGPSVRLLSSDEIPYGANMAFRSSVLKTHTFDSRLGRTGTSMLGWEESNLLMKLKELGHHGIWVGTARVRHFIPASRLSLDFVWNWHHGHGQTTVRIEGLANCKLLWGAPRWAWKKYWKAALRAKLLSPYRGAAWLSAYSRAAYYSGLIDEARNSFGTCEYA